MPRLTRDALSKPPERTAEPEEIHPRLDRLLKLMRDEAQHPKVRDLAARAAAKLMHRKASAEAVTKPAAFVGRPRLFDRAMSAAERMRRYRNARRARAGQ